MADARDGGATTGDDTAPDWRDVSALVAYLSAKPDVAVVGGPVVPRGDVVNLLVGAPRAAAAPRAGADTAAPREHLCREITCPGCGSDELYAACCGTEIGTRMRECVRCGGGS